MMLLNKLKRPNTKTLVGVTVILAVGIYFSIQFMQSKYALFSSVQVNDDVVELQQELDYWNAKIKQMENLTRRLSDNYLDLELLDERARKVLGYIREDEVIIN